MLPSAVLVGVVVCVGVRKASNASKPLLRCRAPPRLTLLDAASAEDVVALVTRVARPHDDADELAGRLARLYERFSPTEATMRRLSLLYQRHAGSGGLRDYAITLVHGVAIEVLCAAARELAAAPRRTRSVADGVGRAPLHRACSFA